MKDLKRVVIARSNPISPNPRVEKAAGAISKWAQVTVLGWDRTGSLPKRQQRQNYALILYSLASPFGSGLRNLGRLLRWELFLLIWILRNGRDIAVFHACDFDTIFPALIGKLLFRYKVVYDVCDFYADHVRNTPQWIITLIRWMDRWAMQYADAMILVDEARIGQLSGKPPKRLEFINNTPPDTFSDNGGRSSSDKGSLRIAYVGLLQKERGIFEMMDVVAGHPDWRFDLAGYGGEEIEIKTKAQEIPGINWHGRVDYEKTLSLSRSADVLFATYDPQVPNHRFSSPNKVFEAMMLGLPVIVAKGTNIDRVIEEWDCGFVVEYGDRSALEIALEKLADNLELRNELGENARKAYEQRYSWSVMEDRLDRLYAELLSNTG